MIHTRKSISRIAGLLAGIAALLLTACSSHQAQRTALNVQPSVTDPVIGLWQVAAGDSLGEKLFLWEPAGAQMVFGPQFPSMLDMAIVTAPLSTPVD